MNRDKLLIDASALLAALKSEPGGDTVRQILEQAPEGALFMHAVNACEVAYQLIKFGFIEYVAYYYAVPDAVEFIDHIQPAVWKRAASLKTEHTNLSLGDCILIAQAELIDADILTGDRAFQQIDTRIGIKLFR